ncbi:AIPR family protein [Paracoccus sp. WLY502]|uniref:AIPR family protein n=1 Tax=Paracoccus yibinensis TaxID=3068891 RepID=UPI002796AFC9|nr:AIPR family protein [Paracoccus sp. WLY502]MDQ1900074.1 AIPR family protein [Paracoccus sp. WLY502]
MHLVTTSYFDAFCDEFAFEKGSTKSFEAFANCCINNRFSDDEVKPAELVYEGPDPGIDGAMLYVDGRLVLSEEELVEILAAGKRELDFEVVFTQVKTSESWSKKEIDTFSAAIVDLLSEQPAQPLSDYLQDFKKLFKAIFSNIKKVKGGRPTANAFFVSAAPDTEAAEINAAVIVGHKQLAGTGFFREAEFRKVPREVLHEWWLACGAADEATLPVFNYSPFPAAPNVKSAYVATVSAKSFIERVLKNDDGTKRKKLFEMNVRDFLGESEEVNSEISETLKSELRKSRFGLMNNGVTIVAESVRPAGQEIFIGNYQIVNGCQTSNVLLSNESVVDETVSLMVKFIESSDAETVEDIVRATNRQSKVEDEQFASTMESLRALEEYFVARGSEQQNKIVFERRRGQ